MKRICVFCGSNVGANGLFSEAARRLGGTLAASGLGLVYGGGRVGLMGVLADAALRAGGEVVGVIPQGLVDKELAHRGLTELRIVRSMHERKALMADLSEGFIALPGGYGTLEEFCEVLTWSQLGLHRKPCGLLNVAGFYDPFLAQIDSAIAAQFIRAEHRALIRVGHEPAALVKELLQCPVPAVEKWLGRSEA